MLNQMKEMLTRSEKRFVAYSLKHTNWFTILDYFMWIFPVLLVLSLVLFAILLSYEPPIVTFRL